MRLYHYTCKDRAALIRRTMTLKPYQQPMLNGLSVVWLTDLEKPDGKALGLTNQSNESPLRCDRTEMRFSVNVYESEVWTWAQLIATGRIPAINQWGLQAYGRLPSSWFVALRELPCISA